MYKKIFLVLGILALLLAACANQAGTPNAAGTLVASEAPQQAVEPSSTPAQATPSGLQTVNLPAKCTVISNQPTPDPTEEALTPPANDKDWAQGPKDAKVTIIEYGDFQ